jgi:hypothetical protein
VASPNMLVAVDSSNNNLHNGHCEIQTFDLTTQTWSHLLETPLGHRMPLMTANTSSSQRETSIPERCGSASPIAK